MAVAGLSSSGAALLTACAPVPHLGCVQRRLRMTGASGEGWLHAAGNVGGQRL